MRLTFWSRSPSAANAPKPLSALGRKAAAGVGMTFAQNVGTRALAFLAQIALARFLSPSDFGQIGLVLSTNAMLQPVMDFGIEDVLMSRRKSLRLWIRPAYGLSITLGLLASLLLCAAAPVAAAVYRDPALIGLVLVMALSCAIYSVSIMPDASLRADMRFGVISVYALADMICIQGLTLILAWRGFGAYAFVLPLPISSAMRGVVFCHLAPVGLRGAFRFTRWRPLLRRGALVFGQRLLQIGREQGDYCVLGVMATPMVVGAYFFAFRLAAQPVYMLVRSLSVVLFPALASLAQEPMRQVDAAVRTARILGLMVTPFSFLLAAIAEPLVLCLFGARWLAAVPYIQILSIALAFDVLPCVTGALATARGLFRLQLQITACSVAFFLVCVVTGMMIGGPIWLACGVLVFFVTSSIVCPVLIFRPMRDTLPTLLRLWLEPVVMAGAAMVAGVLAAKGLPDDWLVGRIAATALAGGLVYMTVLWLCVPDLVREIASHLSGFRQRKRRPQTA